jgi:hypothetical protein
MPRNGKRLILVRNDLIEKATEITAKEGRTLFSLTNEVFERAIEAHDMRASLADAVESCKMIRTAKTLHCVFVPADVFNFMAKKLYENEREELLEKMYESGIWNGSFLSLKSRCESETETLKMFMKMFLLGSDEFLINVDKEKVEVKCFFPDLNLEGVEIIARLLHGFFGSLGYRVEENKCIRGIIVMQLSRAPPEKEAKRKLTAEPAS